MLASDTTVITVVLYKAGSRAGVKDRQLKFTNSAVTYFIAILTQKLSQHFYNRVRPRSVSDQGLKVGHTKKIHLYD